MNKKREQSRNYLPHNFLVEKIVLSSMLINSDAIEIALKTLTIDTFYFKNHQEIYRAIIEMHNKKLAIDIITLHSFLQDNGILKRVGGIKVLIHLVNQIPSLVYFEDYIQLLQDKFIRRLLIKLGYKAVNSGYITNISLENILNDFELQVFNLTNQIKDRRIFASAELLSTIILELKTKSLKPSLLGIPSGFYELDSLTQGLQKSDLIIIAGRPSMGKTALSLNIAINIVKKTKLPIIIFSLEMPKEQLTYRLLSMETKINSTQLRKGKLYKTDWFKINQTVKRLSQLPLFIDDTSNLTIQDIKAKIKQIVFEYKELGLIVIDYLQLMQNSQFKTNNRVQELSEITRSLKRIAKEFNVPIIVLSQLSRNVEMRIDKKPILSDLRESGSIEQDADLVLMLYRDSYYSNSQNSSSTYLTDLIVAKHRNGPVGSFQLEFESSCTKFLNL